MLASKLTTGSFYVITCRSKKLWLDGFTKLSSVLTTKELSDLLEVMRDKEINVRTDVYEILLQDEMDFST